MWGKTRGKDHKEKYEETSEWWNVQYPDCGVGFMALYIHVKILHYTTKIYSLYKLHLHKAVFLKNQLYISALGLWKQSARKSCLHYPIIYLSYTKPASHSFFQFQTEDLTKGFFKKLSYYSLDTRSIIFSLGNSDLYLFLYF